jgi:hypothetical protein
VGVVALIVWAGSACIGLYLLAASLARGGITRQPTKVTRYPAVLTFSHPALALAGLAFWTRYLMDGDVVFAWAAFTVLCGSALLGFAMLTRWLTGIGGRHAREGGPHRASAALWHGLASLGTFVLVLTTISGHR